MLLAGRCTSSRTHGRGPRAARPERGRVPAGLEDPARPSEETADRVSRVLAVPAAQRPHSPPGCPRDAHSPAAHQRRAGSRAPASRRCPRASPAASAISRPLRTSVRRAVHLPRASAQSSCALWSSGECGSELGSSELAVGWPSGSNGTGTHAKPSCPLVGGERDGRLLSSAWSPGAKRSSAPTAVDGCRGRNEGPGGRPSVHFEATSCSSAASVCHGGRRLGRHARCWWVGAAGILVECGAAQRGRRAFGLPFWCR
jgi:hypothetical protein